MAPFWRLPINSIPLASASPPRKPRRLIPSTGCCRKWLSFRCRLTASWEPTSPDEDELLANVQELMGIPPAERPGRLQEFVQQQLAKVMGMDDPAQIDPSEPLFNIDLDSLMALELMVLLEKNLGIILSESLVFEHPTIEELGSYFHAELFPITTEAESARSAPVGGAPEKSGHANSSLPEPTPSENAAATMHAGSNQAQQSARLNSEALLRELRGKG